METDSTALDIAAIRNDIIELLAANRIIIPGIPEAAQQVRQAATDPRPSLAEIARIAEQDPALAAHLIKLSNVVALRRGEEIRNLLNAVTRLGARLIAVAATNFAIMQMVAQLPRHAARLRALYQQSLEIGERCYALALRHPHLVPEEALLTGLVHAIGVPVILQYTRLRPRLQATAALEALLQELQAPIGAELLRRWCFPDHIATAVEVHEDLYRGTAQDLPDYGDVLIAARLGLSRESEQSFTPNLPPSLARLSLGPARPTSLELSSPETADYDIHEFCLALRAS